MEIWQTNEKPLYIKVNFTNVQSKRLAHKLHFDTISAVKKQSQRLKFSSNNLLMLKAGRKISQVTIRSEIVENQWVATCN